MTRYIDVGKLDIFRCAPITEYDEGISFLFDEIDRLPTEDVTPVVHAYWIGGDYGDWFCSECDSVLRFYGEPKHLRYCYRCGAKMDGDETS